MNPNMFAVRWRKSSYSGGQGGQCVELAALPDGIAIRDSKDPEGPNITMGRNAFAQFAKALSTPGARPGDL